MFQTCNRRGAAKSVFALAAALLFASGLAVAGAPLKGVDVKLGKSPGGGAVARTTTDANGAFVFPEVPAGSYTLSFELPPELKPAPGSAAAAKNAVLAGGPTTQARIEIVAAGKETVAIWDFEKQAAFDPAPRAAAKEMAAGPLNVEMKTNGRLVGSCVAAVLRSR
jgi:Carboxypeptidase regulatory-like domain